MYALFNRGYRIKKKTMQFLVRNIIIFSVQILEKYELKNITTLVCV